MSQHTLPDYDAWISRFKALQAWVEENGSLPENDPDGGRGDTLRTWLNRQRAAVRNGTLESNLEAILRSVPGAVQERCPTGGRSTSRAEKIRELEEFHAAHGRLPAYSGTAPGEKRLYKYLNDTLRPRQRKGMLSAEDLERLGKIPGIFQPRVLTRANAGPEVLARDPRTAELVAFCETHGRPPASAGPGPEVRLYTFMSRTIRSAARDGRLDEITTRRLGKIPGVLTSPLVRPEACSRAAA